MDTDRSLLEIHRLVHFCNFKDSVKVASIVSFYICVNTFSLYSLCPTDLYKTAVSLRVK